MVEQPTAVAKAIAAILDTPIPELPKEIAEIIRIRSATRRVLEANLDSEAESRYLRGLARRAASCSLKEWAYEAILAELKEPDPPDVPPLDYERSTRRLRRLSFDCCPTCRGHLPHELDFRRWERLRRVAAEAEGRRAVDSLMGVGR